MSQIILSEDQARIVADSTDVVEVLDSKGQLVSFLKPLDPTLADTIRECKRRLASSQARIPSEQVQAHLRKLEEIRQREGMDRDKMLELLRRMRAGEEV